MNFRKAPMRKMMLLTGVILALLTPEVPLTYAETEDVKIIGKKPDPSDPRFELVEVEGGLFFRVPKDMPIVKQDGIIGPISSDKYCAIKIDGVNERIDALNKRIDALERNSKSEANKRTLTSP